MKNKKTKHIWQLTLCRRRGQAPRTIPPERRRDAAWPSGWWAARPPPCAEPER